MPGPRIFPAGHAVTPYGGHLDPTVFQRLAPGIMPLSVAEGIANGVDDVSACVRYQIRHGAKLIKVSASGGVMSHSTAPGSQQYSDDEFEAIADEAHRAGVRVAAHAVGDSAIRACIRAGIDCIEHGFLATDDTIQMMVDHGTFLVSTTYLDRGDGDRPDRAGTAQEGRGGVPAGAGDVAEGDRRRCPDRLRHRCPGDPARAERQGTVRFGGPRHDARCRRCGPPRSPAPSSSSADDELGRLAPGYLADIIAVPGDPSRDIATTLDVRFVMKDGQVHKR